LKHAPSDSKDGLICGWKILTYSELIKKLKYHIKFNDNYKNSLLGDYCTFVKNIDTLFSDIVSKELMGLNIATVNELYDRLKSIKMHDVYHKLVFNILIQELNNKLTEKYDEKILTLNVFPPSFIKKYACKVYTFQHFSRGTAIITVAYQNNDFRAELQLQNNDLKYLINHPNNPKNRIAKIWLDKYFKIVKAISQEGSISMNNLLYPVNKTVQNDGYKHYGKNVIYKNIRLNNILTLERVVELMLEEFNKIYQFVVVHPEWRRIKK